MIEMNQRETLTPIRISVIEMPVWPTLDVMSNGHNIESSTNLYGHIIAAPSFVVLGNIILEPYVK